MTDRRTSTSTDAFESQLRSFAHATAPEPPPHLLDHVLRQTEGAPQASGWRSFSWPVVAAVITAVVLAVAVGSSGWLQVANRPMGTSPALGSSSAFASAGGSSGTSRPGSSSTPPVAVEHADWVRVGLPDPSGDVFGGTSALDVVAFDGGYVAVGAVNADCCASDDLSLDRGIVWKSADGISWELHDGIATFQHARLNQIVAFGGRLIASGTSAEPQVGQPAVSIPALWTSSDGTSWERVQGDVPAMITIGPRGLVGIVTEPSDATTDPMNWFATSSDGLLWKRDSIGWPGDVHDMAARADGIFVAVGASSEDRPDEAAIWYTSEAGGWIEHTPTDAPDAWLASVTVFDGQFFVAVDTAEPQPDGSDRGVVWATDDPTTGSWRVIANLGNVHLSGIFALRDALVAVGTDESEDLSDATAWVSTHLDQWGQVSRDKAFAGINNEVAAVIPTRHGRLLSVGWYFDRHAGHLVPVAWIERAERS